MASALDSRLLEGCLVSGVHFQRQLEPAAPGEMEWDSAFLDELSDLVDADEALQDEIQEFCEHAFEDLDLDLDLMPWNSLLWNETHSSSSAESVKPEPQSPASSTYSVPSPQSVHSVSSTQDVPEELDLGSTSQLSPDSLYTENPKPCFSPELPVKEERASRNTPKVAANPRVKQRKLAPVVPKTSLEFKSILVPAGYGTQTISGIAPKTIILQPLPAFVPKQQPSIGFQAAPARGHPVLLAPSAVVQLQAPGVLAAPPVLAAAGGCSQFPNQAVKVLAPAGNGPPGKVSAAGPIIQSAVQNTETDVNLMRRQERMIKNRESAFQSRRKKKEYMQTMETRLRTALAENEKLKKENGSLQKLLEDLESENIRLKVTAPKRRAVCLMIVVAFVMLNFSPLSLFEKDPSTFPGRGGPVHQNRHLLGFSPGEEQKEDPKVPVKVGYEHSISNDKALMVVKEEALIYVPPPQPPCQPQVNRTESRRLAQELRGWVHRHEVERTKSRRMSNHQQKTRVLQNTPEKSTEESQLMTMQYSDVGEKNPGSELQVYYASPRSYQDFLEALRRRGDTFYVVSFRRDHLLLPATNRNKTTRPKMSIVLPAMNVNENVINGQDYEVMMQIDCEVMDTRILHIKASSIPPFLREHKENQTNPFYGSSASSKVHHVVSAIAESAI